MKTIRKTESESNPAQELKGAPYFQDGRAVIKHPDGQVLEVNIYQYDKRYHSQGNNYHRYADKFPFVFIFLS